jgi:hypothetical protein
VAFALAPGEDAVRLAGAPKGCALTVTRPKPVDATQTQKLSENFFEGAHRVVEFRQQLRQPRPRGMPLTTAPRPPRPPPPPAPLSRASRLRPGAVAAGGRRAALLFWLLSSPVPTPPVRAPSAWACARPHPPAPASAGQNSGAPSRVLQNLRAGVGALKEGGAVWPLLAIGFAYGVFHAAGPGHGKR